MRSAHRPHSLSALDGPGIASSHSSHPPATAVGRPEVDGGSRHRAPSGNDDDAGSAALRGRFAAAVTGQRAPSRVPDRIKTAGTHAVVRIQD